MTEETNRTEAFTLKLSRPTATQVIDRAYVLGISRNELLNRIVEQWLAGERRREGIPDAPGATGSQG